MVNPKRKSKRRRRKADKRGVALILVLGAITVLTVLLTELQEQTSSELSAAITARDTLRAEYLARSGVNLSRLLIALEPNIRAGIPLLALLFPGGKVPQLPVWKYQDMVLGAFNDSSSSQAFTGAVNADLSTGKNIGITGGGRFELNIVDEDSKININTAAQNNASSRDVLGSQLLGLMANPEYNPLFEGRDADNQFSDRQTVCGALVDWADSDPSGNESLYACDPNSNNASATGAEDNFYQMIGLGYRRKNAAFDSLDELRLVRGVGDDFWSTFVDPDPTNPDKRNITVWGSSRINMITANAQTIVAVVCADKGAQATFCVDPMQVAPFLQMLTMAKAILPPGVPVFGSPQDLVNFLKNGGQAPAGGQPSPGSMIATLLSAATGVTLKPVVFSNPGDIAKRLGTSSKMFSIYSDGIVPGNRKTIRVRIHAVLDFRSAAPIGTDPFSQIPGQAANSPQGAPTGAGAGGIAPNNALATSITPDAYTTMLRMDPGGTVVYWRVE